MGKYLQFKSCDFPVDNLNCKGLFNIFRMASWFEEGMDFRIVREFLERGKEVDGLELRVALADYNPSGTIENLLGLVQESDTIKKFKQAVINKLFLHNLLQEIEDASLEEMETRNSAWLEQIKTMNSKDIVCVGCKHLYDDVGLLNKLYSEGYSVVRMVDGDWVEVSKSELVSDFRQATIEEMKSIYQSVAGELGLKIVESEEGIFLEDPEDKEYCQHSEAGTGGAGSSAYLSDDSSQKPCLGGEGSKALDDAE